MGRAGRPIGTSGLAERRADLLEAWEEEPRTDTMHEAQEVRSANGSLLISKKAISAIRRAGWRESNFSNMMPAIGGMQHEARVFQLAPGVLQLEVIMLSAEGKPEVSMRRTLDSKELVAYHNSFQILDSENQGRGLGVQLFHAAAEEYKAMGIERIELYANSDVGGYFWARVGFQPSSRGAALMVRKRAEASLQELQETVWRMEESDLPEKLTRDIRLSIHFLENILDKDPMPIDQLAAFRPQSGLSEEELASVEAVDPHSAETLRSLDGTGECYHSGKGILLGSGWSGVFDLRDKRCQKIFTNYLHR